MILIIKHISEIQNNLEDLIGKGIIIDYRIILHVHNKLSVYLKADTNIIIKDHLKTSHVKNITIETLNEREIDEDPYYKVIFAEKSKINLESRRRLSSLLESSHGPISEAESTIITFYSYKGGVGRSTTLALCAAHFAWHYEKKVVIIDCDFEAPGFTNYFLEEPDIIKNNNGLIEYLIDSETSKENLSVLNYSWEVSKEFTNKGEIRIIPAGNLDDNLIDNDFLGNSRRHYLEALSRVNLSNKLAILEQFKALILQIQKEISPDIILIDTRTGFNDIFGATAFNLAHLVVGFFGNNAQSQPGLQFFIESISDPKSNINAIIVNSILSRRKPFAKFEEMVDHYLMSVSHDEPPMVINKFPIMRESFLETIGTSDEDKDEFKDLIKNKNLIDYNNLFDNIGDFISSRNETLNIYQENPDGKVVKETTGLQKPKLTQYELKIEILKKLIANWPSLYGENFDFEQEIQRNRIFFRKNMEDIFNPNKLLILGNKGTGKTYLYEALKNSKVVKSIQSRANKLSYQYEFFHIIDKKKDKFFDTNKFNDEIIGDKDLFYEKFWLVLTWNAIVLESEERLGYKTKLTYYPIKNDTTTKNRFLALIKNDEEFAKIEADLNSIDLHLKRSRIHKNIIVIFDGLDNVVKPINWDERISPLIKYWRTHSYSLISPKLFIRSDLYEKLSNITNKKELSNQAISIEWNKEELYAYFFKYLFSCAETDFFEYISFNPTISNEFIKQIKQKSGKENQLPLDEYYLKPLVRCFFGKYASMDNTPRYGESFDWFFRNLKNADETISLRPFIDLIEKAINDALQADTYTFPLLPALYYAQGEARKIAVENHFNDLASESGNENLKIILNFIRDKKSKDRVFQEMFKPEMVNLLKEIIEANPKEMQAEQVDSLIYLLKVNGIISEKFWNRGDLVYAFALLYKYYLGLRDKPKRKTS
jgi:MinD-like ATPase involved in chromosome partitioning or flagellar assembly